MKFVLATVLSVSVLNPVIAHADIIQNQITPIAAERAIIEAEEFLVHTLNVNANLTINNSGLATIVGRIVANAGTSHIVVNAVLYRVNPNGTTVAVGTFNFMK